MSTKEAADTSSPGAKLRSLISEGIVIAPGAFNPFVARLIEDHGFDAVYAGGSAISTMNYGRPDIGLSTMTEIRDVLRNIAHTVDIPVLGDIDQGFGELLNVRRAVREFEEAGLAGVHVEDDAGPSKDSRGALAVPEKLMVERVQVACEARRDPDFMIFARSNAMAKEGFEAALERSHAYVEAGADGLWLFNATFTPEQLAQTGKEFPDTALIYNMTLRGTGPSITFSQAEALGFNIVILPNLLFYGMAKYGGELLEEMRAEDTIASMLDKLATVEDVERLNGLDEAKAFQLAHPR